MADRLYHRVFRQGLDGQGENSYMDSETRAHLQQIQSVGTGAYRDTASALLEGRLTWPDDEVRAFVDGFLHDPYLTRND